MGRKWWLTVASLLLLLVVCVPAHATNFVDPDTPAGVQPLNQTGWSLTFSDEFENWALDSGKWNKVKKCRGTGNNGQYWCWNPGNLSFDGNNLVISYTDAGTVTRSSTDWGPKVAPGAAHYYDAAGITTQNLFEQTYGFFEASIRLVPGGNGAQSAFWLMSQGEYTIDGTANDGEEIDILESNYNANKYSTNIHYDGYGASEVSSWSVPGAPNLYTGFHKFGLEWSPDYLKFYYDGALKRTISNTTKVSDAAEYIILSGGILGWDEGDIRNATLPINEKIAYVRVWTQ